MSIILLVVIIYLVLMLLIPTPKWLRDILINKDGVTVASTLVGASLCWPYILYLSCKYYKQSKAQKPPK